jgi:hypothetical protein
MLNKTYPLLYLGYGANTNRAHMKQRCPTARYIGNAELIDHRLTFRGVADVIPAPGRNVVCALWEIMPKDEASLDVFEGVSSGMYVKRYADLTFGDDGETRPALYYTMQPTRRDTHAPPKSYERTLREGYAQCEMPAGQIDEAIRHASNGPRVERRYAGKWAQIDEAAQRAKKAKRKQASLFDANEWPGVPDWLLPNFKAF